MQHPVYIYVESQLLSSQERLCHGLLCEWSWIIHNSCPWDILIFEIFTPLHRKKATKMEMTDRFLKISRPLLPRKIFQVWYCRETIHVVFPSLKSSILRLNQKIPGYSVLGYLVVFLTLCSFS